MTRILGLLTLAAAILAFDAPASQADDVLSTASSDNYHYFVHAGNCSRSMQLRGSYTCPDEAAYAAQELQGKGYVRVWVNTSPRSYL